MKRACKLLKFMRVTYDTFESIQFSKAKGLCSNGVLQVAKTLWACDCFVFYINCKRYTPLMKYTINIYD